MAVTRGFSPWPGPPFSFPSSSSSLPFFIRGRQREGERGERTFDATGEHEQAGWGESRPRPRAGWQARSQRRKTAIHQIGEGVEAKGGEVGHAKANLI